MRYVFDDPKHHEKFIFSDPSLAMEETIISIAQFTSAGLVCIPFYQILSLSDESIGEVIKKTDYKLLIFMMPSQK